MNDRYEQLAARSLDGMVVHDGEKITEVNEAMMRLAGATQRDQLVGHPVAMLLAPPHLKSVARYLLALSDVTSTGATTASTLAPVVRERLVRLDGTLCDVDVSALLLLENDEPVAHLMLRDVTARLEAEQQVRNDTAKAQSLQRLQEIRVIAGGVAHEINNMLQIILGFATILEEEPLSRSQRLDVAEILKASSYAAGITHQLVQFGQSATYRPRSVDLQEAITRAQADPALDSAHRNRFIVSVDETPPVWVDPPQLQQVLVHLLTNAERATTRQGDIWLTVREVTLEAPRAACDGRAMPPGRYATISVRDSGVGIPAEIQPRIFQPFFTTRGIGQGAGLGLSAVQGMLAQNNGFLTFTSTPSVGSEFCVWLQTDGRGRVTSERAHEAPILSTPHEVVDAPTILVVVANASVRTVAGRSLERAGYRVHEAGTGDEALDVIHRLGCPALVVTDEAISGMTEQELSRRLRSIWPMLPMLVLTTNSLSSTPTAGVDSLPPADVAHIDPHEQRGSLAKPFSNFALVRSVQELLRTDQAADTTP